MKSRFYWKWKQCNKIKTKDQQVVSDLTGAKTLRESAKNSSSL